jgi:hypothetical protein
MNTGQSNSKLGKLADPAAEGDGAAVLLGHDVVTDREAKAGAFPGWPGCEERLKELVLDLGWNADAVVAYLDLNRIAEILR